LACIAVFPLVPWTARFWSRPAVQLGVSLFFGLPMALYVWSLGDHAAVIHASIEYVQFMVLLGSLFVITGGVFLRGDIEATPAKNTALLGVGTLLASFVGTTGAAVLMIRPLLNVNRQRTHRVHTVVFAIFAIANCGGLLTPLGDPPLFLGMLRGVPFSWTMTLFPQWLFVNFLLLLTYWSLDCRAHALEPKRALIADAREIEPLRIEGKRNLLALLGVVLAVAWVPSLDVHALTTGHARWTHLIPYRELVMGGLAFAAYRFGDREVRFVRNEFRWHPILEVAALFAGIFLAMVPALKVVAQLAPSLPINAVTLFVFTGSLSAVLDNAPTYATFFELARQAGGQPSVAGVRESYLAAVSMGAVFCGAITYIGNGPNFMVKAIADGAGVTTPSFGAYAGPWAFRYLVPILALMVCVFVAEPIWANAIGVLGAAAWAVWALRAARRPALATALS
jgi:Na+/H+ antiporter NhaD/arsenite permease-like protein